MTHDHAAYMRNWRRERVERELAALYEVLATAWDEGAEAMKKARLVQGESLPQNPYRL